MKVLLVNGPEDGVQMDAPEGARPEDLRLDFCLTEMAVEHMRHGGFDLRGVEHDFSRMVYRWRYRFKFMLPGGVAVLDCV